MSSSISDPLYTSEDLNFNEHPETRICQAKKKEGWNERLDEWFQNVNLSKISAHTTERKHQSVER